MGIERNIFLSSARNWFRSKQTLNIRLVTCINFKWHSSFQCSISETLTHSSRGQFVNVIWKRMQQQWIIMKGTRTTHSLWNTDDFKTDITWSIAKLKLTTEISYNWRETFERKEYTKHFSLCLKTDSLRRMLSTFF